MKAVTSHFFEREFRRGPFVYVLNDLHQSNILVDEDWNIRCLIDLEWACSRPIEMLHPPHWLTSQSMDLIDLDRFTPVHQEFVDIIEEEEKELQIEVPVSKIMSRGLRNGTFWFSLALMSPTGLYTIFYEHIRPRFAGHEKEREKGYFEDIVKHYWTLDIEAFIAWKLKDKAAYDQRLRKEFDVEPKN